MQPAGLRWEERIHHLVRLVCGVDAPELPTFHPDMLALEGAMAEPHHHRRAHEELAAAWGGRRYVLLLQLDPAAMRQWADGMEQLCCAAIWQAANPPP